MKRGLKERVGRLLAGASRLVREAVESRKRRLLAAHAEARPRLIWWGALAEKWSPYVKGGIAGLYLGKRYLPFLLGAGVATAPAIYVGSEIQRVETERVRIEYRDRIIREVIRAEKAETAVTETAATLEVVAERLSELERKVSHGDKELQALQQESHDAWLAYERERAAKGGPINRAALCARLSALGYECSAEE